jgi:hypothetical protein
VKNSSLVAVASLVLTAGTPLARADDALAACRAIKDDVARLECYDSLARRTEAAVTAPAATATAATAVAAPAPAQPAPNREDLFGRNTDTVRQAAGDELKELTAVVVAVQSTPGGKLVLQLDNGQVWSQVDSSPLVLRDGAHVKIRRASLGSFLLTEVGHNRSIRVRRAQ